MDSVLIKDAQDKDLNIQVIRYFRLNGSGYLVFSLNEIDDGGYVKLYICKVNNNIGTTISDDVEWNLIKDTIKVIIKSNKDNIPLTITDLNIDGVKNIKILDQKVFKLNDSLLQLLAANKKVEDISANIEEYSLEKNNTSDQMILDADNYVSPILPADNSSEINNIIDPTSTLSTNIVSEPANEINNNLNPVPILPNDSTFESTEVINNLNPVSPFSPNEGTDLVSDKTNNSLAENQNLDYKNLYETEMNKNKLLTEEVERYKTIISELRKVLNETF